MHFTFLDPRNSNNSRALVRQAQELAKLFEAEGYGKGCIVFSVSAADGVSDCLNHSRASQIPATEEGAQAARKLEKKYNLKTNLLFVSGLAHAAICAQAGASFVTFPYKTVSFFLILIACRAILVDIARQLTKGSVHRSVRSRSLRSCQAPSPTPKRLADEAIEAAAEYFNMHGIATRIILSVENVATVSAAASADRPHVGHPDEEGKISP